MSITLPTDPESPADAGKSGGVKLDGRTKAGRRLNQLIAVFEAALGDLNPLKRIAVEKAGERAKGAVLASDAFFPFRDGPDAAAAAGVTALIQPGGSRRDNETLQACDEHGLAMILTGRRHFRH